jgi:hypothetical protein
MDLLSETQTHVSRASLVIKGDIETYVVVQTSLEDLLFQLLFFLRLQASPYNYKTESRSAPSPQGQGERD